MRQQHAGSRRRTKCSGVSGQRATVEQVPHLTCCNFSLVVSYALSCIPRELIVYLNIFIQCLHRCRDTQPWSPTPLWTQGQRHDITQTRWIKLWQAVKKILLGGGSSATLQVSPRYGMTYFKFSSSQVRPGLRNDTDTKVAAWPSRSHDLVIHHHPLTLNCHTWLVKDADSVQTVVCPIHDTVSSVVSLTNVSSSLGISGIAGTSVVSSSLTIIHTHMHNNEPVFPQTKKIYPASSKVHLSTSANLQIKQTYVNVAATSDTIIQTAGSISWAQTNIDSGTGFSSTTDLSPTRELTSTYTKRERFFRS